MNRRQRLDSRRLNGTRSALTILFSLVVLAMIGGCGLLNGSTSTNSDSTASTGNSKVEKPAFTIGILSGPDDAPIKLAQVEGIFRAEGLNPAVKVFQSGPSMYPALMNGSIDIGETNYVNFFTAVHKKTLNAKIVAEAYSATSPSLVLLTPANSAIRNPADLAGKKIATQAPGNICELLVRSLMRQNKLDPNSPKYVPIHFPDMPSALKTGQVDAAVEFDPFITQAQRDIGARTPFPLLTAVTDHVPLSGYAASDTFTRSNPKTVAAFQRSVVTAHERIVVPGEMAKVLPGLTGVAASLVPSLHIGDYPTSLDPEELQQVVTLMRSFGYLTEDVSARDFIVPMQGS